MRCPTLSELPPPPSGKTGWPWTESSPQVPDKMPDGSEWPKISIVTPNYNYGQFIEETIRSVLLQGYPNLEYIVIDGNSTDNSVEIIKKYEPWLTYWVSEKDKGQTNAINKGLCRCNGELFNWINSDDQLLPNALSNIAIKYQENPTTDVIIGGSKLYNLNSGETVVFDCPQSPNRPLDLLKGMMKFQMSQPATFLRLSLIKDLDGVREDLHNAFDWCFYVKALTKFRNLEILTTKSLIANIFIHPNAKTQQSFSVFIDEEEKILHELEPEFSRVERMYLLLFYHKNRSHRITNSILEQYDNNNHLKFLKLASLVYKYPPIITYRYYLGALKNALIGLFK
jgi:glycosyltransferase involved in cell wall biosynthesis